LRFHYAKYGVFRFAKRTASNQHLTAIECCPHAFRPRAQLWCRELSMLAGRGVGSLAACASAKLLASLLCGVTPRDASTFKAVLLALFACYPAARRAMRLDPMEALCRG
jgi:hypothetical protein